jgi:16S rRNA (adenine1518-N6/adenine1519-N6)-dimethyltransferase
MIDARVLLREASLFPKKSFGQNFLVSERTVRSIAEACVPDAELGCAKVLELGAGLGALTSELLDRAAHVTAVERDRDLVPLLARALGKELDAGKLTILEADAQAIDLDAVLGSPSAGAGSPSRVLCGNLPYQITGRLLQLAVTSAASVDRVVFMVQDEVAERLVASPGTKDYGALTVFVRAAFDVTRLFKVSRGSFHPPPDVTSSVVRLVPVRPARATETDCFRALVRGAFGMRRKTLRNAWASVAPADVIARVAAEAGVSLDARGETLSVEDYARAAAALERAKDAGQRSP